MSRNDSDQDHSDWLNGPYPDRVQRTCRCGRIFWQIVDKHEADHDPFPLCPRCEAVNEAEAERRREEYHVAQTDPRALELKR